MIVMKFGGTSVEDEKAIERAAQIVLRRLHERPVVVVSALAGVTDSLLAMSRAAASGRIQEALKLLRPLRRRHLAVLNALVKTAAGSRARRGAGAARFAQDLLRGVAALGELTPRTTTHSLRGRVAFEPHRQRGICAAWHRRSAGRQSKMHRHRRQPHSTLFHFFELTDERLRHRLQPLCTRAGFR